jgi:hypothetical protein
LSTDAALLLLLLLLKLLRNDFKDRDGLKENETHHGYHKYSTYLYMKQN